jgi:hypothetical protein
VARGDALEAGVDLVEERAELDVLVAEDVGAGRAARLELGDGVADDAVPVRPLERADLERDIETAADLPREAEVLLPGAAPEMRELVLEPDLEVEGRHVMAFRPKKAQGDGAVDPAREQNRDLHGSILE